MLKFCVTIKFYEICFLHTPLGNLHSPDEPLPVAIIIKLTVYGVA